METAGYIHSFQSMGAVDGPGLRYVIFLQGCPLRCAYCHNPDTWEFGRGTPYSPGEVLMKIQRYRPYLKNGGVTVTGGEPLSQPEFTAELFRLLKEEGFHTALDTSGIGSLEMAGEVLSHTDLVLADVKFLSSADYQTYCRGNFENVIQFLNLTRRMQIPMWVRRVVVPGLNDEPKDIEDLISFLTDYDNVEKVELLPFRKLCLEKYERLDIPFPLVNTPEMAADSLSELQSLLPSRYL
ncbi:pyruvate formate-lyase-activating protein [Ruminococcus gauvreauii]|uniref:Pyruvate formate-lyase-activating enzyme n=1 Tax=Ruminococcus gauvreauii TaxID=438033 RepID=A0ABY5VK45_9FIRM|nr:pyruvate formate-lyase-activating protein [Ruminococcus gauvreauii]UWP59898.1 pyruvate formate-lyase-activating protein [Ruminococcus gauvreauii]